MTSSLRTALAFLLIAPASAQSATVTESWTFDALYESISLRNFAELGLEPRFPNGRVGESGLSVGETFSGVLSLEFDVDASTYTSVNCNIGAFNCVLGSDFEVLEYLDRRAPSGPVSFFQLGQQSVLSSFIRFGFGTGSYEYLGEDNGFSESSFSEFSLSNVAYSVAPSVVPVPASFPLLLVGLGGLALMRRKT